MTSDLTGAAELPPTPPLPAEPKPRGNARKAVGLILRTSLVLQLINTISGVELARGLGLHGRGALAAAILWPMVAGNLGTLGIEESMTYHVAREPERAGRLAGSGMMLCALQSLLFSALTVAIIPVVLSSKPTNVIVSAWIYTLYVPLQSVSIALNAVLNGLHRYEWFNRVLLTIGLLTIGAQTLLLALGALSVRSIVIAYLIAQLLTTLYVVYLVRKAGVRSWHWDRKTMRSLFAYGIRSHASTVPTTLNYSLDQLVISIFLSTAQLGVYVIAVTFTSLTVLIGQAVARAALPNVAGLPTGPARATLARRLVSATLVMSTLVTIPLLALTPQFIRLFFGHAFLGGTAVCRILLVATIALSTNRVLESVLRGVGRPLDAGVAEVVALGATAVGLATLLPPLGILGAGWASLAAYVVSMGYMVRQVRRALEISPLKVLLPDREAVQLVAAALRRLIRGRAQRA
jgi:O-antigen/teichoic acid export membrane protein